jgi:AraC-like DNA-binding protein
MNDGSLLAGSLRRRPTLAELERVSGLCRFRLCTLFKRSYRVSVGEYRNALRLRHAVYRLERGDSIRLVISEFGYRDESYFWRVFKAHYGVAPGEWRSMFRANDWVRRSRPARAEAP